MSTSTTAKKVSELERLMKELAYQQMRTDMAIQEFSDGMQDFKKEMKDFKDEMKDFKDEMKDFKDEMSEYKNKADQQISALNKRWGELTNKWGTFSEDIVAPNIPFVAKELFGFQEIDDFMVRRRRKKVKDHSKEHEFDVMAISTDKVIIAEVKSNPKLEYVKDFIKFLPELFDYFPEFSDRKIIPILASMYLPENIVKYLTRYKIYAMQMAGDSMKIVNFDKISKNGKGSKK